MSPLLLMVALLLLVVVVVVVIVTPFSFVNLRCLCLINLS